MAAVRCPFCRCAIDQNFESAGTLCPGCGSNIESGRRSITLAKVLNIAGLVLTLWAIFFPIPYTACVVGCVALPWVAIYVLARAKGLVVLNAAKRSKEPSVSIAFIGPCLALGCRALFDVQLVTYQPTLLPTLASGLSLTVLAWYFAPDLKRKPLTVLLILPFALGYGLGLFMELDCLLDTSQPQEYTTVISNKRVSSGSRGGKYYYLDVRPWGPFSSPTQIRVTRKKYDAYRTGESITLRLKQGALRAQWYYIAPKRP